jgi:uncharacterized protein (DUF2249 family)
MKYLFLFSFLSMYMKMVAPKRFLSLNKLIIITMKVLKRSVVCTLIMFMNSFSHAQELSLDWVHSYGSSASEWAEAITHDTQGNIYTTGHFQGFADFDPSAGTNNIASTGLYDIFVSKSDPQGNVLWVKTVPSTEMASGDQGKSIAVDLDGNVYISGLITMGTFDFDPGPNTYNLTPTGRSTFLWKLDTDGNFVWAKILGNTDYGTNAPIAVNQNDGVYISGFFNYTSDFDPSASVYNLTNQGNRDIFLVKLDTSGSFVWAQSYGSTGYEEGNGICIDPLGNVNLTGYYQGTIDFNPSGAPLNLTASGTSDMFILNISPTTGETNWAASVNDATGMGIVADNDNNLYITGSHSGTSDFDPGIDVSTLSATNKDAFVLKLSQSGDFIWVQAIVDGSNECMSYAIDIDSEGNIYTTGSFKGTADFDPDLSGVLNMTSHGGKDIFISNIDTSGTLVWAGILGSNAPSTAYGEIGRGVSADFSNGICITGAYQSTCDFDPDTSIVNITSNGYEDIFLIKLNKTFLELSENNSLLGFKLFPNPASEVLFIQSPQIHLNLKIYNIHGELEIDKSINGKTSIPVSSLSSGVYYVIVEGEEIITGQRLVITK